MSSRSPTRSRRRRTRIRRRRVAGLLVVLAALVAVLNHQSPPSPSSAATATPSADPPPMVLEDEPQLGEAGGGLPDDATAFDDLPGVARLDGALLGALREAATDAADDGVRFVVDSGWRSPDYQRRLLDQAISKYGSAAEAARWVATPNRSAHVSGDAVDIGPANATAWLSAHGAAYGLCQIYGNEPWHYELRPDAVDHGCPGMYPDPTHDPRMQQ